MFGQYHNSSLHQQAGGNEILVAYEPNVGSLEPIRFNRVSSQGEAYSGEAQRLSGLPQPEVPSNSDRVVFNTGSSGADMETMGASRGRPLRNPSEFQAPEVCVTIPSSGRLGGECFQHQVVRNIHVCVPSVGDSTRGATEVSRRAGENDSHSSNLDMQDMVPTSDGVSGGGSNPSASSAGSTITAAVGTSTSESGSVTSSSVVIIGEALMNQGFSSEVSGRMAQNIRKSSLLVYDSKWKVFGDYCANKHLDPLRADIALVAEFLNWLFVTKKRSTSTIKGYRSAISRVLKRSSGLDISSDQCLKDLISNFYIERPFATRELPKWDLNIVLKSLAKAPYEPIIASSLTHLSRKTAFLLLLASGVRRGELHAIEVSTITKSNDKNVWWLKPNPGFVAKNFRPQTGKGSFNGFKITRLKSLVNDKQFKDVMCPIRALQWYIHKTSSGRRHIRQLFLTCNKRAEVRPIHKNTLSAWIEKVIMEAYQEAGGEATFLLHRSAHEVRAVAASFAAFGNVGIEEILKQCRWSGTSTFAKHYLRRMSGGNQGLKSFLPLQMAGSILRK